MDASNLLKPALARGDLHCIGATTLDEYRKYIEKDAALARRFQSVLVEETTVPETVSILRGLKEKYEVHHGVRVKDSALVTAANLAHRYITDRFLPDSAISVVDDALARLRMQMGSKPDPLWRLERQLITMKIEREALKKENDPGAKERLAVVEREIKDAEEEFTKLEEEWKAERDIHAKAKEAKEKIDHLRTELQSIQRAGDYARAAAILHGELPALEAEVARASQVKTSMISDTVDSKDVAWVISHQTGIPVENLLQGEQEQLLKLEQELGNRVIGQQRAVQAVSNAVRLSRAGLQSPNRPLGSFLFLGPTGTGKTELCKALSEYLFDDEKAMVRIDMSEYMEKFSVSRLVGAPPGYVGFEDGGTLTEAVRRKPYQVVLFDEFEKAHPEVSNLLLQVLDEGFLTDSQGRQVDFRNTIVIMTSNIGSATLSDLPDGSTVESARPQVMEQVRGRFQPEFINRIDDIILFSRLSREDISQIVDLQLRDVDKRLADRKITLHVDNDAKAWLALEGYDPVYGARPLKRVIQTALLHPLATKVLAGEVRHGDTVRVSKDPSVGTHAHSNLSEYSDEVAHGLTLTVSRAENAVDSESTAYDSSSE
eukprot:TRINITY_DN4087_c0_g1_i2.p1 TRINITY_DN4087_c0_g1~~TRINITY_DN4087_c0_g1_i2.p1  ORF type:complete len:600 (+),score=150.94 TRINITY_DN4087_c0_g1_i2:1060-2859(+)